MEQSAWPREDRPELAAILEEREYLGWFHLIPVPSYQAPPALLARVVANEAERQREKMGHAIAAMTKHYRKPPKKQPHGERRRAKNRKIA